MKYQGFRGGLPTRELNKIEVIQERKWGITNTLFYKVLSTGWDNAILNSIL